MLHDINLCHEIVVVLILDDGIVVDISKRSTIVGLLRTAAERQVMVLHKSGSGDDIIEVVVESAIVGMHTEPFGSGEIFVSRQHIEFLRHRLNTYISLIRNLESLARTLLGLHLYHARSATRTIQSCLGSILQHRETLNVGRIDSGQCGNVARHAVDDDKRVVASNNRCGTTHSY